MRIAIPVIQGKLSLHFGHCDDFAIADVDEENKQISEITTSHAPSHEPGALPRWLVEQKVDIIIAAGMGKRAQMLLEEQGIKVLIGAPTEAPEPVIDAYLDGSLQTGANICDH